MENDLGINKRATFMLRVAEIKDLEKYIKEQKEAGVYDINKSSVVKKALKLLYKQNKKFNEIIV